MFDAARRWLWVGCAVWVMMPGQCGATAQGASDPCVRPSAGSLLSDPAELRSRGGVLSLELSVRNQREADGSIRYCYVTATGEQSPTLRMRPGELLVLKLKNELADLGAPAAARAAGPTHVHGTARSVAAAGSLHERLDVAHGDESAFSWLDRAAGLPPGRRPQDFDRGRRAALRISIQNSGARAAGPLLVSPAHPRLHHGAGARRRFRRPHHRGHRARQSGTCRDAASGCS